AEVAQRKPDPATIGAMHSIPIVAIAVTLTGFLAGQVTSPHPICFAFNDTLPTTSNQVSIHCGGLFWLHFTAPANSAIDEIDLLGPPGGLVGPYLYMAAYQTVALGVPPSTTPLGTLSGGFSFVSYWAVATTPTPLSLTGGSTYAISIAIG